MATASSASVPQDRTRCTTSAVCRKDLGTATVSASVCLSSMAAIAGDALYAECGTDVKGCLHDAGSLGGTYTIAPIFGRRDDAHVLMEHRGSLEGCVVPRRTVSGIN